MKTTSHKELSERETEGSMSEILVLPDGRVFAHNISPVLAQVLAELDPADEAMKRRAGRGKTT